MVDRLSSGLMRGDGLPSNLEARGLEIMVIKGVAGTGFLIRHNPQAATVSLARADSFRGFAPAAVTMTEPVSGNLYLAQQALYTGLL